MRKPLAIDLFCGLGGWTEGLLAEGYEVIGFDIEQHVYGEHRYPAQLVVNELGIEDSHVTPAEAIRELRMQAEAWKEACRNAGVCMSCAIGTPEPFGCTDCLNTGWNGGSPAGFIPELPREPGTCKCGAAPINKDGVCATCADEQQPVQWRAFYNVSYPKLWGIETTDRRAVEAGLEILIAPCMPEHAAKTLSNAYNSAVSMQKTKLMDCETIQVLLDLLNPLHGEIDRQTYDERYKQGFDAPADAEYNVDITACMERDLTQAVLILEARQRSTARAP